MINFLIFISIISVSVFAEIQFHFPSTNEGRTCKEKVQMWIDEVNKMLPEKWIPSSFHVQYTGPEKYSRATYFSVLHYNNLTKTIEQIIIFTGLCEKASFIHEYGHLILDDLMRKVSPSWQYFVTWNLVHFQDIDQAKIDYLKIVESLEKIYLDLIESNRLKSLKKNDELYQDETISHIRTAISKYNQILDKLNYAQQIQSQSSFPLNQFNSAKVLDPFEELFADTVTVLVLEDWSATKQATILIWEHMETNGISLEKALILPKLTNKEEALLAILRHRDFVSGLSIEQYPYAEWEEINPYFQFAPIRSWIRNTMESKEALTATDMIQALGLAIIDIYERELIPNPKNLERPLLEKNQSLRHSLTKKLFAPK